MFSESASLYDAIYSKVKDYKKEANQVHEWIHKFHPKAKTLLDVACGTGEHAKYLRTHYQIDGLDLNPDFITIAREKNPSGTYRSADMVDFDMGKKYDVLTCLFSSIGYVLTRDKLRQTIARFTAHLDRGGIMLVEPWFTPEQWKPGRPHMVTVSDDHLQACRMNISETRDGNSFFQFHYLLGTPSGVRHFTEDHTLGLFSTAEMKEAFSAAGLSVEFDEQGIFGRGLYIAKTVRT